MGSGKGQTRRAQTATLEETIPQGFQGASYNGKKWADFMDSSECRAVPLYEYYLGFPEKIADYTLEEEEKVVTELFLDALHVGAIVLPQPHVADDFRFVCSAGSIPEKGGRQVRVVLKSHPDLEGLRSPAPYLLRRNTHPVSDNSLRTLGYLAAGINSLLDAKKRLGITDDKA